MLGNVLYIVIGTILGLLVITIMLMVGIVCYCKHRGTRRNVNILRNQSSEGDFTNSEEQFEEIFLSEEITLEKTNEPDVILCSGRQNTEELRNVYSEEPKLAVNLNDESEIKSVAIQEEENIAIIENNGSLRNDEDQCEDMSDAECGYSTIDDLSGDDESEYHCIDGIPSAQSDTDSLYTVINDLFELPSEDNYYLSLYGGSDDDDNDGDNDDEESDIYHRISTDLSDDGSEHNYNFINEWKSTDTFISSIAVSEDENGYLLITGNTPVSSTENLASSKEDDENDNNEQCEINVDSVANNDISVFISMPNDQSE